MAAMAYFALTLRVLMSRSSPVPITIIKNERQQSAVNTALRISVRLASSGCNCSWGICESACISDVDT